MEQKQITGDNDIEMPDIADTSEKKCCCCGNTKEGPMSFKVYFERVANDLKQDYQEK